MSTALRTSDPIATANALPHLVPEVDGIRPSLLGLFGLAYLALTPFAILHGNIRIGMAIAFAGVYAILRPKKTAESRQQLSNALELVHLQRIYIACAFLFVAAIFCDAISATILLGRGRTEFAEIADRGGKQLGTLAMCFVQLASGYHVAKSIRDKTVLIVVYAGLVVTLAVCGYQAVAEAVGLPYIGLYSNDSAVGLRPSGLLGEPKVLAVYILTVLPLPMASALRRIGSGIASTIPQLAATSVAIYFFIHTASGNGFLSAAILVMVYFIAFATPRRAILATCLLLAALAVVPGYELSGFKVRGSHQSILDNLQNLDLELFDDLIILPMLAWKENPLNLLIGFGPGMLHFFAWDFVDRGTWIVSGIYIDGNLGAIKYASDFGLILGVVLFAYILRRARRIRAKDAFPGGRPVYVYFVSTFLLGALVGGNVTGPLFLSIGWILGASRTIDPPAAADLAVIVTRSAGSTA